jgi:hypothetical protein
LKDSIKKKKGNAIEKKIKNRKKNRNLKDSIKKKGMQLKKNYEAVFLVKVF